MNISVHIERLVLEGIAVPYHRQPLLQAAVEGELTRLLTERGLAHGLQTGAVLSDAPVGQVQLSGDDNPTQLGREIARAVYGGLGQ